MCPLLPKSFQIMMLKGLHPELQFRTTLLNWMLQSMGQTNAFSARHNIFISLFFQLFACLVFFLSSLFINSFPRNILNLIDKVKVVFTFSFTCYWKQDAWNQVMLYFSCHISVYKIISMQYDICWARKPISSCFSSKPHSQLVCVMYFFHIINKACLLMIPEKLIRNWN